MTLRHARASLALLAALAAPWLLAATAHAQLTPGARAGAMRATGISPNPDGVNVRHTGATTVFLTFRGVREDQVPAEGIWCGEINANGSCRTDTIFGRLPTRLDIGRISGTSRRNFTDIMNIPPSVARRAFQAAQSGAASEFFYVRRFVSTDGRPDEFPFVSCRMAGGGARSPLSITDVTLRFAIDRPVLFVPRNSPPPQLEAQIVYTGSGRFKGRWEIVNPGDPQPSVEDLLTEATLPVERRGLQRRYTVVQRFDVFLPPRGTFTLPGPDPARLPHQADGLYQVLLRIEATDDREGRSQTLDGEGFNPRLDALVFTGGVAGFPIPPLRYYVGTGDDREEIAILATRERLRTIVPRAASRVSAADRVNFSWLGDPNAMVYQVQVEGSDGPVLEALVSSAVSSYTAPPWVQSRTGESLRWRVVAIGADGDPISRSGWAPFEIY